MSYERYYKQKLEEALEYEDFIYSLLHAIGISVVPYRSRKYQLEKGENIAGIEIKHDERFCETGNLYIETAEKAHPANANWVPSGIYREDNGWLYITGDYENVYIFATAQLRYVAEHREVIRKEIPTSKGFLLSKAAAKRAAIRVLDANEIRKYMGD